MGMRGGDDGACPLVLEGGGVGDREEMVWMDVARPVGEGGVLSHRWVLERGGR